MLQNDFYVLKVSAQENDKLVADITLNKAHAIFEGHFPNIPVVPGVALLQIVKETIEYSRRISLFLTEAKSMKFLDFINPQEISDLTLEIIYKLVSENALQVQAVIKSQAATHFKLNANYKTLSI